MKWATLRERLPYPSRQSLLQASAAIVVLFGSLALGLYIFVVLPEQAYGSSCDREMWFIWCLIAIAVLGAIPWLYELTKLTRQLRHRRRL